MYYYEVSPVGIVRSDSASFTYQSENQLEIGSLVMVEIGKSRRSGVVIGKVERKPPYPTKEISRLIEKTPLPRPLVNLAAWLAKHYVTHPGTVWQTVLPRGLDKQRRERKPSLDDITSDRHDGVNFVLNKSQQAALETIATSQPGTILLHGITGSGKTRVYIEAAKQAQADGKSTIILTPEIGLTTQLLADITAHFPTVILTHSRQTEAERHLAWRQALTSELPIVAIGPRSALFMPLKNIGLVVIDEAHEPSYKQEQSPRYMAARAASILSKEHGAKLILGTATPLIADYYTAERIDRPIVKMSTSAQAVTKSTTTLIDMTKRENFKRHRFLSVKLLDAIETTLAEKQQVLLFHNRRGSASVTLCDNCGWQAGCPHCFIPLTLHGDSFEMRCHICGLADRVPTNCPSCKHVGIIHKGIGTKLVETELKRLFPDVALARFDGDTGKDDSLSSRYQELYRGDIPLIIGTQVVAKGLDLPRLGLVGVLQADAGLSLPDYSSSERTFQLLAQAVGRVGRTEKSTKVIVQSYQPTHPAVAYGLAQDYDKFYQYALKERKRANFPPFCYLLKLTCAYKTEAAAIKNARALALTLKVQPGLEVLGPTPAFYERQRDTYRWQLVIKSTKRQALVDCLKLVPPSHWQTELDPVSLL